MNTAELRDELRRLGKDDRVARIVADLNRFSPSIGATGPPDQPGPEEPYIQLVAETSDTQLVAQIEQAVRVLLLEESLAIERKGHVQRPLLLYNLFSLLEAVKLPGVVDQLRHLCRFEQPLAAEEDDLYAQLLLAHAVNQEGSPGDLEFWRGLLEHPCVDYVNSGVVGLRESGPQNALRFLPEVKQAHRRRPELGPFETEVMLLLDTYPEFNWSVIHQEYCLDPDTTALIKDYDQRRYRLEIAEMTGPAAETIRQADWTHAVKEWRKQWTGNPAAALLQTALAGT